MRAKILVLSLAFGLNDLPAFQNRKLKIQNPLGGFDYLTCFQAARAYANALCPAADKCTDTLQVWIKAAVSAVVGVADSVTKLRPLTADLAAFRHCCVPPMRIWL